MSSRLGWLCSAPLGAGHEVPPSSGTLGLPWGHFDGSPSLPRSVRTLDARTLCHPLSDAFVGRRTRGLSRLASRHGAAFLDADGPKQLDSGKGGKRSLQDLAAEERLLRQQIDAGNQFAQARWNRIQELLPAVRAARDDLDEAMAGRSLEMVDLCKEFARTQAELAGLPAFACNAAQGSLNIVKATSAPEERSDAHQLSGCSDDLEDPRHFAQRVVPWTLGDSPCTRDSHTLLCSVRLRDLKQGAAAPAASTEGGTARVNHGNERSSRSDSMAAQVREFCHPTLRLYTEPVGKALALGKQE